jgi:hypothetical protein
VAFYTAPYYDYTVGDASNCYDSGKLTKFLRHVVYVKPEYFLILDELQSEGSPRQFEWLLHTDMESGWTTDNGKKITVGETLEAKNLVIERTKAKLATQILLPKEPKIMCDQHRKLEVYGPFIRVSSQGKEPQMRFLTMLCPMTRNGKGEKEPPKAELMDKIENGAVGVKVARESLKDNIMFNLGGGMRSVAGIKSDAENCLVTMDGEKIVGYALHNGTALAVDEKLLILSSNPVSTSVRHLNEGLTVNILLKTPAKIGIASPKPQRVTVGNIDLAPQNFAFDTNRQILTLWLREGEHIITVNKTP